MSVPSIETDDTSSTIIDDDMSITVHDLSDTTVATQTSTSWHSVMSDVRIDNNRPLRSHSVNAWLRICLVEPNIRLTTAQEWKLRTCMRRFLALCDLPLKVSCTRTEEYVSNHNENDVIAFIDQERQSSSLINPSPITYSWSDQQQRLGDQLQQLNLFLRILPIVDPSDGSLEVQLSEVYARKSVSATIIPIILTKEPRFVFHIALNMLIFSLRSANALLELRFAIREAEGVRGSYYQWNEIKNEHVKFSVTAQVDQSQINEFHSV